jgi:hypothetical protein
VRELRRNTFTFIGAAMLRMHEVFAEIPAARGPLFEEFVRLADDHDSAEYFKLRRYLDLLEDLAAGVIMEVFDADVVWHVLGTRMLNAWELAGAWIRHERQRLDHPTLFKELEECAGLFQHNYGPEAARRMTRAPASSSVPGRDRQAQATTEHSGMEPPSAQS